jgi:hypothetical protein
VKDLSEQMYKLKLEERRMLSLRSPLHHVFVGKRVRMRTAIGPNPHPYPLSAEWARE